MKHRNRKRWLTVVFSLVVMLVYLACVGLAEDEIVLPDTDAAEVNAEAPIADTLEEDAAQVNAEQQPEAEKPDDPATAQETEDQAAEEAEETPVEPTDDPANTPAEQPADDPTETPAEAPTEAPTEQPPVDPSTLFQVEIKQPDGWFNTPERNIRILITPKTEQLWSKVSYRMDNDDWQEVRDNFSFRENAYYADVPVTYNGTVTVRVYTADGGCFDTKQAIRMFDHHAPEVTAGIKDTVLHVVATDDLSEVAGVQVNGLLFTTLLDGTLDVRIEEPLNTYKQFAIRAYDYAGNFSEPVTLDNPYYQEATPTPKATKKPAATKKPTATPTAEPTATEKPTKKPAHEGEETHATKKPKETEIPTPDPTLIPTPIVTPEPVVIVITPEPVVTPEPIIETEYVPIGPGQPFHSTGNMRTLDVLYSAATNKQFITVQSKAGQTYYLIIDFDQPIDEENEIYETYFLNLVDDRDLMSVLTDEEIVPTPTPQIIYVTPEPTIAPIPTAAPTEEPVVTEPEKKPAVDQQQMMILGIGIVALAGLAFWFIKNKGNQKKASMGFVDEDDYDVEDSDDN